MATCGGMQELEDQFLWACCGYHWSFFDHLLVLLMLVLLMLLKLMLDLRKNLDNQDVFSCAQLDCI